MLPTAIASVRKLTQMDKAEDNCRASSKTNGFGPISNIPIFSLHLPIKTFHSSSLLLGFKPFPPPPPLPAAEMAAKSLIRTGAALMNRMMLNPILNRPPNPPPTSGSLGIIPLLFPSLSSNPGSSLHFPNNDAVPDPFSRVSGHGFLHPCGLPTLPFFCPEGDLSDEPMLLFPKRTFQPSTIRRKRNHGFFARKATKGGRRVINRRIAKGRSRVTA